MKEVGQTAGEANEASIATKYGCEETRGPSDRREKSGGKPRSSQRSAPSNRFDMRCSKRPAQNDRLKNDQREQTGSERPAQNALLKTIGSGRQAQNDRLYRAAFLFRLLLFARPMRLPSTSPLIPPSLILASLVQRSSGTVRAASAEEGSQRAIL